MPPPGVKPLAIAKAEEVQVTVLDDSTKSKPPRQSKLLDKDSKMEDESTKKREPIGAKKAEAESPSVIDNIVQLSHRFFGGDSAAAAAPGPAIEAGAPADDSGKPTGLNAAKSDPNIVDNIVQLSHRLFGGGDDDASKGAPKVDAIPEAPEAAEPAPAAAAPSAAPVGAGVLAAESEAPAEAPKPAAVPAATPVVAPGPKVPSVPPGSYSYTFEDKRPLGLHVRMSVATGRPTRLIVDSVAEGSAAEELGVAIEGEIVGVNGKMMDAQACWQSLERTTVENRPLTLNVYVRPPPGAKEPKRKNSKSLFRRLVG